MDLKGRRCLRVERRAKYLLLHFDGAGKPVAMLHLGMSGRLSIDSLRSNSKRPPYKLHEHWRMDFGKRLLRYVDARRFGMLDVIPASELSEHKLLASLGPEPLQSEFNGDDFFQRARKRKASCKTFLMDAKNVVGIGNIYASEACFRAGIRPRKAVQGLSRKQCHALVTASKEILQQAIESGGTTLRDHQGVDESAGYFQRQLMVYGRQGESCLNCDEVIRKVVEGRRSTFYCPRCQG